MKNFTVIGQYAGDQYTVDHISAETAHIALLRIQQQRGENLDFTAIAAIPGIIPNIEFMEGK